MLLIVSFVNLALAIVLLGLIASARAGREVILPLFLAVAGLCGVIAMRYPAPDPPGPPKPDDPAVQVIVQAVHQNFVTLQADVTRVEKTVTNIQTNVQAEIKTVTTNINDARTDIKNEIKNQIENVQTNVTNLHNDIVEVQKKVITVNNSLVQLSGEMSRCRHCSGVINIHKRSRGGHRARQCGCRRSVPGAPRAEARSHDYLAY
jgi:septal ring factor EnvC (AmiA/AmiB activator)